MTIQNAAALTVQKLALLAIFLTPLPTLHAQATPLAPQNTTWNIPSAQHVYGLPEIKPGKSGTLTLTADTLTFTAKSSNVTIPRASIVAVSNGSDRVELWGTKGRVVRMMIPDGGGIAAAAFMHHRVGMLTVDYLDIHGGKHSAVFNMSPATADASLASFNTLPIDPHPAVAAQSTCAAATVNPNSVLVLAPNWEHATVPAAYRALVYEHVVTRLQAVKGVSHVYRDGEQPANSSDAACPAYTVRISVNAFKQGNQVYRATLGPVGMLVGATQLAFDFNLTDASGRLNETEQLKASVRMESESTTVADSFAKKLAKHYAASLKTAAQTEQAAINHPTPTGTNTLR